MATDCRQLVEAYVKWLGDNTRVTEISGVSEITTPFLDRHNDHLQIYVRRDGGRLLLTDDAYVITDLRLAGLSLDTPRRKEMLNGILLGFGVSLEGDELVTTARPDEFPQKKHALLQAMLAVDDLFATATPTVVSLFLEDIARFLDASEIRHLTRVQFTGKSHFVHKFDFAIPASREAPERLLQAVNRPSKESATSVIFAWTDVRQVKDEAARMYAFLNDTEREVPSDITDALREYDVVPVPWSQRSTCQGELAA